MDLQTIYEIIGYAGSVIIAISLSMKSLLKLRWLNMIGAAVFSAYGLLIGAMPIFIVNGYIAVMNVWYLVGYSRDRTKFSVDSLDNVGHYYFDKFYQFYKDDIKRFFPDVTYEILKQNETFMLFRDMIPVGILSLQMLDEGKARIHLDYMAPPFRDFKFGKYLYQKDSYVFRDRNIHHLEATTSIKSHRSYLLRQGFKESFDETNKKPIYTIKL